LYTALFKENRPGYLELAVEKSAIKSTIYSHPEFTAFIAGMNTHFVKWREKQAKALRQLKAGSHPKEVIANLSADLLAHYTGKPLINKYDIYQHLMDYWAETMQDDCYLIVAEGWKAETYRVIETKNGKDGKPGKEVDKGWACDLVPKVIIVARYFAKEQVAISNLEAELESVAARIIELEEENGGEDGAFAEARTDAPEGKEGKVTRSTVTARLKQIEADKELQDEVVVLEQWLKLADEEGDLKKQLKKSGDELDVLVYAKYPKLSEAEIKALAVDDKWLTAMDTAIHSEMDRVSQAITTRVKELAERYETPMPKMVGRVTELEAKVNSHLKKMGFAWN